MDKLTLLERINKLEEKDRLNENRIYRLERRMNEVLGQEPEEAEVDERKSVVGPIGSSR